MHLSETIQLYVIPAEAGRATNKHYKSYPKRTIIITNPKLSRNPKQFPVSG